jgi:hypothetical protein
MIGLSNMDQLNMILQMLIVGKLRATNFTIVTLPLMCLHVTGNRIFAQNKRSTDLASRGSFADDSVHF